MKVKVGGRVFDGEREPVMVILSEQDKQNINNMLPDATRYAMFPEDWGTEREMQRWMEEV